MTTPPVLHQFSYDYIRDALKSVGLKAKDKVLVHSSLKSVVPDDTQRHTLPDGGMPVILQALKDVLTDKGLLIFPTFSPSWAREGKDTVVFEGPGTRTWLGAFPDFIVKQKDFFRSGHPTHNLSAWGTGAKDFVKNHHYSKPVFAKTTPWGELYRRDVKILMLGTWLNSCTAVHLAEEWLGLPYMTPEEPVRIRENGEVKVVNALRMPGGPRDFYKKKGSKIEQRLLKECPGIFSYFQAGACKLSLVRFRDLVGKDIEFHYDDPLLLLNDPTQCPFAKQYAEATVNVMRKRKRGDWKEGLE